MLLKCKDENIDCLSHFYVFVYIIIMCMCIFICVGAADVETAIRCLVFTVGLSVFCGCKVERKDM